MAEFCETCPLAGECSEQIVQVDEITIEVLGEYNQWRHQIDRALIPIVACTDSAGKASAPIFNTDAYSIRQRIDTCPRKGGANPSREAAFCSALGISSKVSAHLPRSMFAIIFRADQITEQQLPKIAADKVPLITSDSLPAIDKQIRKIRQTTRRYLGVGAVAGALSSAGMLHYDRGIVPAAVISSMLLVSGHQIGVATGLDRLKKAINKAVPPERKT